MRSVAIVLLFISVPFLSNAQICTGSLGDPVVQITFGGGGSSGGPLSASTTNYSYASIACPADGSYTVTSSSPGCFTSTWHTLTEDHTPNDVNGYMMVVNASFTPGDFYVETISGLCENSTYEFSAWIMNILKNSACGGNGIEPNLTFNIETTGGANLGKYETGGIPQSSNPQWKQYGLFFKTPANVNSVVVRITNNAPGGCGNDLVLDDIIFRPCGPTVSASVIASGTGTNLQICENDLSDYNLAATISTGYSNPAYQWQVSIDNGSWQDIPGAQSVNFTRVHTAKGEYRYRITVAESGNIGKSTCRVVSNLITVKVNEKPVVNAGSNSPVCEGDTLLIFANNSNKLSWTGPNGFTANYSVQLTATRAMAGKYYVTAVSVAGCTNNDSTIVRVNGNPVAGTINGDIICEGSSIRLNATGGSSYSWTPVSGLSGANTAAPSASPLQTTKYVVTVKNDEGCTDTASVVIQVNKKPVADAGPDKKISEGQSITLNGKVQGTDVSYLWTPNTFIGGVNTLTPVVNPSSDLTYTLHAISNVGCGEGTDDVFIRVFKKLAIPNAFSPNGDGINDTWQIEALETYPEATLTVFNRYGQRVYVSRGYSKPWDGKMGGQSLPPASYYYVIDMHNEFPTLTGWIMIIR